jgi:hypothetical protein
MTLFRLLRPLLRSGFALNVSRFEPQWLSTGSGCINMRLPAASLREIKPEFNNLSSFVCTVYVSERFQDSEERQPQA